MNYEHLLSSCNPICEKDQCNQVVKQGPNERWYITMGHNGFNSPANNRDGYSTKEAAIKASKYYGSL